MRREGEGRAIGGRLGWGALALVCLLAGCASAPRYTTRVAAKPRTSVTWPRHEVLDVALRAYQCGRARGELSRPLLTVIDYSLPSSAKRLWVIDVARRRVLFHELVAHGVNSGDTYAFSFSNRVGSRQSSLGLFRTDETYHGRHGRSLRLSGLEPGVNDNARERAIVVHAAEYVSDETVSTYGRVGRSWGCPALPAGISDRIIDHIQGGSALFAYYPDRDWLQTSRYVNCGLRVARNG